MPAPVFPTSGFRLGVVIFAAARGAVLTAGAAFLAAGVAFVTGSA